MRIRRLVFSGILALGLTLPFLPGSPDVPGAASLVRIDKGAAGLEHILQESHIIVVQELRTCYLGICRRDEILDLWRRGIPAAVLDRDTASREYFLVRPDTERPAAGLAGRGRVVPLEPGVLLFRAAEGAGAGLIPPGVARKPLPRTSITPYLRTVRTRAVETSARNRDAAIAALADGVSRENLRTLVKSLQDFGTRLTGTAGNEAAAVFLENYFRRQGLAVRMERGLHGTSPASVVGVLEGRTYPEDEVIVCAHFDSISDDPEYSAPGADDNASGVAAVMEAARILAGRRTEFTVCFVAFSGEEQGLLGSEAFAKVAAEQRRRIVGVINLDMIAFADRTPEDLDVVVNEDSDWLGTRLQSDAAAYGGPAITKIVDPSVLYSDHSSFWDTGIPALLGIEDMPLNNPHYHTTGDLLETLDIDFCARVTRAALATAAGLAQIIRAESPRPPADLTGVGSFFSAFLARRKNAYLAWPAVDGAAGYNIYRSETSHLNYVKANTALVTEETFSDRGVASDAYHYYVVTAVDAAGAESGPSREIEIPPYPRSTGN